MPRSLLKTLPLLVLGLATPGCYVLDSGEVTDEFTFHSDIVGDDYRIRLFEPPEADPAQPLPVIFILDGDEDYGTISSWYADQLEEGKLPPALMVGVGYGSLSEDTKDRKRDYLLPTADAPEGRVEAYYRFLQTELFPALQNRRALSTAASDHYLMGHSLGGLAALYGLLRHNDFIARFGAGSPSVDQLDYRIFDMEAEFASRSSDLPAALYISSGTQDGGFAPTLSRAMADRLQSHGWPGFRLRYELHEGRTHVGVVPVTLRGALHYLLGEEGGR